MDDRLLADLILILHLCFIIFVLFGGLLCLHRLFWAVLHLPAALWGIWIEWSGGICPLTPLENHFRTRAYGQGYSGGFIEHYLIPVIYPTGLTTTVQFWLGAIVIVMNCIIYIYVFYRQRKTARAVD